MPIDVIASTNDAPEFIGSVNALSRGLARIYRPESIILIKVDGWFGFQWRGFSGKVLGLLGTWRNRDILPPFVPSRIESQKKFAAPDYDEVPSGNLLHQSVASDVARTRMMRELAPNAVVVWYSGNSAADQRASLMAYVPMEPEYLGLYCEWKNKAGWILSRVNGISRTELDALLAEITSPAIPG